jgi:hypothetical protein
MERIARGEFAGIFQPDRALVVGDAAQEGTLRQLCSSDPDWPETLQRLRAHVGSGRATVACVNGEVPYCTTHTGVIDPPDSDFERTWVFFAHDGEGTLRIRALYFGFYGDEDLARVAGRTARFRCGEGNRATTSSMPATSTSNRPRRSASGSEQPPTRRRVRPSQLTRKRSDGVRR